VTLALSLAVGPAGGLRCFAQETRPAEGAARTRPAERPRPATRPVPEADTRPTTRPAGLEDARELFMRGKYAAAARGYEKLASQEALQVAASVGLAETLAMQGKYGEAMGALDAVGEEAETSAEWHLVRSQVLRAVGRYEDALAAAVAANRLRPDWAPTILACGTALETLGRKKDAIAAYESMERVVSGDAYRKDARSLTALGQVLDRYAVLTGRRASEQAANILHNYFQLAYQEVDRDYWPANVAAGVFLLSKHKPKAAMEEFKLAAKANPRVPDVHVGVGVIQLGEWNFETCLRAADMALKFNPKHADALLLKAYCLMQWRKYEQVPAVLERILKTNPNHLDALSLAAARHIRLAEPDKAEPYIERVRQVDPTYAGLPEAVAEWLAAARQFDEAERYYKRAIELAPEAAGPVAGLGLLHMQTGDEDQAREVLAKARRIDDFREDVFNYLRLLERLEEFAVRETEHFIIRVHPEHDAVLLNQVARYAEEMYVEVCGDFDHEPDERTIIEVFPTHSQFSVRISGKGWIGTVGASTGRVIVMVAPHRERSQFGTYNWATVIRHEFAHTVTLSATRNRIPHWFTEACAVWEQPDRRNYEAVQVLVAATQHGKLFPVRRLDWGFIRPKRRADRSLAYAQAEWILEYLIARGPKGYATVGEMLRGFRDGLTQDEVFKKVLGMTEAEFDKGFRAWAREQIAAWGYPDEPPPDLRKARAAAKKHPEDAEVQARLAAAYYYRGGLGPAEEAARATLELDETNTMALAVLARVLTKQDKHDEAIRRAKRLEELDHTSRTAPEVLSRCYLATQRYAEAIDALETLKARKPFDPYPYEQLAKLYTQLGQPKLAAPNLIELHRRTMTDPQYARQAAEIHRDQLNLPERSLEYWRQVAYVNPYEASAYRAATGVCINLGRFEQAVEAAENMTLVQGDSPESWSYLAVAKYHWGRSSEDRALLLEAREAADKALEIQRDFSTALRVKRQIDRALGEDGE